MPRILLFFIILLGAHVARAEDEPGNLAGEAEAAPPLSQFEFDSEISQLQAELRAQRDLADLRLKALETEIHTVSGYTERLLLGFLIAGGLVVFVVLYTMSKQTSVNNERMRNLIREADNALDTLHRFTERPEAENFQVSRKLNHIMNKFRERESLSLPQKEMADIYAAAEDPTLPVTLHIQANALRAEVSGDWATAIELWERLLALDSSLPEILLHLAQNYKRLSEVTTDASVERLRMASLEYFQKYSVRTSVHTHSERELRKTGRIGNEKISEHSHNQPAIAPSPYPSASAPQLDPPVVAPTARTAPAAASKPSMTQTLLSRQEEGAPSAAAATQKIVKQVKETVVDGVTRAQEFIDEAKEKAAQEAKAATEAAARKAKEKAEAIRAEKARQEAEAKAAAEAEAKEKAAAAKRLAKAKAKAAADAKREQEEAAQRAEEEKRAKQEASAQAKKEAAAKAKAAAEEQAAAAAKREKEERKAAAKQAKAAKRAAAKAAAAKAAQDQAAQEQAEAEAAAAAQAAQEQAEAEAEAAAAKAAQEQAEAEAAQAAAEHQAKEEAAAVAARQAEEEQRQAEAEAAAAKAAQEQAEAEAAQAAAEHQAKEEAAAAEEQPAAEPEPAAPARVYEEVIVSNNGMPIDTIHKSFKSRLDKASEYFGRFHQTKSRSEKKEWLMAAVEEFKLASKYKYSHDMVQLWGATLMEMGSFDSGSLTEHAREAAVVYAEGNRHFDDAFCNELALCYAALGNEAECRKAMETGLGKQMLNPAIILEMSEFDKFKPRPWFQEIASTLGS